MRLIAVTDKSVGDAVSHALPRVIAAHDTDTPADMLDALALAAYTDGSQPYASTVHLDEVRDDASLLPPGAIVLRSATTDGAREAAVLAAGDGWTVK